MNSIALRFAKFLKVPVSPPQLSSSIGVQRSLRSWYSTGMTDGEEWNNEKDKEIDDILNDKPESQVRGDVDPKKGWEFRGVHKAIICGKVGQAPVQKILRNGQTVTVFTVGTGGLFDQRILGAKDLPRPAQWHRIAVHNDFIGAYVVKQIAKKYITFC
uniref:Single-stranded DNA-binding protein n=1 Tax=Rhizophora mucronata TaxID=61149 RepID=A0A2P2KGA7_RHIMU